MLTFRFETILRADLLPKSLVATLVAMMGSSAVAQTISYIATKPEVGSPISPERIRAQKLFQAITAVRIPIDDFRLKQMEGSIKAGDQRGAAAIATSDELFYDVQLASVARELTSRDLSVRNPITDFVATFVGCVRDSDTCPGTDLLKGNFFYRVEPSIATANGIRQVEMTDFIGSNNHYADLQSKNLAMKNVLVRQSPQRTVMAADNTVAVDHPDPAGLWTTRGFTSAFAVAGTNRALIAYGMQVFACVGMQDWADKDAPDVRVGRDVTRTPGGDPNNYLSTCKACHAQMDGFRGAFAYYDFNGGQTRISTAPVGKMDRNGQECPTCTYRVTDNSWENFATLNKNAGFFGWRSPASGTGAKDLGRLLGESRAFSRCMVKRAFQRVCRRSPLASEEPILQSLASQYEVDNYNTKRMYESVALRSECVF